MTKYCITTLQAYKNQVKNIKDKRYICRAYSGDVLPDLSTKENETGGAQFRVCLDYIVSSRPAWVS
jgi:hypothetical protein